MTELLEKAFEQASRLPREEQDALARWLLDELASERQWSRAFAASEQRLTDLAQEALEEHRSGQTETLDPDRL